MKPIKRFLAMLWILMLGAGFFLGIFTAITISDFGERRFDFLYDRYTIDQCVEDLEASQIPAAENLGDLAAAHETCYRKIRAQGLLNEALIRRVDFQHQHIANQVIMWVVVALTMAGVTLAALQIYYSTRLYAARGDAPETSEITIERNRIYFRSSVTGLFMLLISFGFFYVYVLDVYKIDEQARPWETPQLQAPVVEDELGPENAAPLLPAN